MLARVLLRLKNFLAGLLRQRERENNVPVLYTLVSLINHGFFFTIIVDMLIFLFSQDRADNQSCKRE